MLIDSLYWPCDSTACVHILAIGSAYKCTGSAEMITRSELLESKLPAPDMSTSPSGLNQAEQPRQSHPETVQALNVAPAVQTYINGLPATPERFKPIDYKKPSVRQLTVLRACLQKRYSACVGMRQVMS